MCAWIDSLTFAAHAEIWEQILNISVYLESNDIPKAPFGKRATAYLGTAPLGDILQAEIGGDQVQEMQESIN